MVNEQRFGNSSRMPYYDAQMDGWMVRNVRKSDGIYMVR